jgi:hypothetical protein
MQNLSSSFVSELGGYSPFVTGRTFRQLAGLNKQNYPRLTLLARIITMRGVEMEVSDAL